MSFFLFLYKLIIEVEDNECVDMISEPIVTSTEAINGLENALKYIQQKDLEVDSQIIKNILKLKREISYRSTLRSKTISN